LTNEDKNGKIGVFQENFADPEKADPIRLKAPDPHLVKHRLLKVCLPFHHISIRNKDSRKEKLSHLTI